LNTPGGTPASVASFAKKMVERGVFSEAFITMVLPAARQGAALNATMTNGPLKALMAAQMPMGPRRTIFMNPLSAGKDSPSSLSHQPA